MKRYATFILILFLTVGLGACKWKKDDADAGATVITDDNAWDLNNTKPGDKDKDAPVCGNNKQEGAEVCDDGNTVSGDGCSAVCKKETKTETKPDAPVCGNGKPEGAEVCDDGNTKDGDTCSADCKKETVAKLPDTKTPPSSSTTTYSVEAEDQDLAGAKVGEAYAVQLEAKCGSGACKFEITTDNDALPKGLSLNAADGKIVGTLDKDLASQKLTMTIKVSDGDVAKKISVGLKVYHPIIIQVRAFGIKNADDKLDVDDRVKGAVDQYLAKIEDDGTLKVFNYMFTDNGNYKFGLIGFDVADKTGQYQWSVTVDDKPADFQTKMGVDKEGKEVSYIWFFTPSDQQSKTTDYIGENIKISVKDNNDNEGSLLIKKVKFVAPGEAPPQDNTIQKCATPKNVTLTDGNGQALKLGETGENEITAGQIFKGAVGLEGGKIKSVQIKDEKFLGCTKIEFKDKWKVQEGKIERSFEPVTLNTCSGSLMTDVVTISVTDADCNTTQDVTLELVVQYPDVLTTPVSEITKMWLEYETEWTNDDTLISVRLVNRHGGSCASADIIGTMVNAKGIGDEGKSDFNDEAVPFGLFDNVKGKDKKIQDIDALCVRIRDTSPASVEYTGNETADNIIGIGLSLITSGVHAGVAHGMDLVDMTMKFKGARVMTPYWYADIKKEVNQYDVPGKDWVHMDAIDVKEADWKPRPNPGHATTP